MSLSLSLITFALAIKRVPFVLSYDSAQPQRSLYSSIECFMSCSVANAIVLNSFARDRGPKRNKFRGPGGPDMVFSPEQIAKRGMGGDMEHAYVFDVQSTRRGMKVWGSDADLVKDTGVGMNEDLREMSDNAQRNSEFSEFSGRDPIEVGGTITTGGTHGCATWTANWDKSQETWRPRSEHGKGRGLILPPPPQQAGGVEELEMWDFSHRNRSMERHHYKGREGKPEIQKPVDASHKEWKTPPSCKVSLCDAGGLLK